MPAVVKGQHIVLPPVTVPPRALLWLCSDLSTSTTSAQHDSPPGTIGETVTWRVAEQVTVETAVSDQLIFGWVIDLQTGGVQPFAQFILLRNQEVDSLLR